MRAALASLLMMISLPAAAQEPAPAQDEQPGEPIIVTGIRIQDYRTRLEACLARNCPPNEDADATLALAEALFLNGDYEEGRLAVHESLRRNRDEARGYPEPVSDLYRAHSRLSRHLGFDADALRSTHGILDALQDGIPQEDYRHFTARFEIAEMQMMMGRLNGAERELSRLAGAARAAGREDVATMAELRTLWYQWIAFPEGPARSRLIEMSRWTDPGRRMQTIGAKILLARIYRSQNDHERADALLAEVGRGNSTQRRLIHSPTYQLLQQDFGAVLDQDVQTAVAFGNTLNRIPDNYVDKWIDVGFWVLPDGHVSGLELLRRGGNAGWSDPLMESIRGRLYSTAEEATYRLERYTYTAGYEAATGTRIRQQGPRARVEFFDLTGIERPPPPPTPTSETPSN